MAYLGMRAWLDDGTTRELTDLSQFATWTWSNARGIVFLSAYLPDTYLIWTHDAQGNLVQVVEYYLDHCELADYFWYDPATQTIGCGTQADVPAGALIKKGKLILENAWRAIYDQAYESRTPPGV